MMNSNHFISNKGISGQCSDPVSETTVAAKLIRPSASGGMKSPVIAVRKSARKPGVIYANVSDS